MNEKGQKSESLSFRLFSFFVFIKGKNKKSEIQFFQFEITTSENACFQNQKASGKLLISRQIVCVEKK